MIFELCNLLFHMQLYNLVSHIELGGSLAAPDPSQNRTCAFQRTRLKHL
jgi:hypothetical protein